jgi:hypothetical protein
VKLLYLAILLLLLSACASGRVLSPPLKGKPNVSATVNFPIELPKVEEESIFPTPFGYINKGDTKEEVTKMLGNPHFSKTSDGVETWYYYFDKNKTILVDFRDNTVIKVRDRKEIEK